MNESDNSQFSELVRYSRPMMTLAGVITILIMVIGVLGNTLTAVALIRHPRLRTIAASFIACLAFSDLLICILVLPFSASQFFHGTWIHGEVLCVLVPVIRYGSVGVSLLSIGCISLNRYVLIAWPHLYQRVYTKLNVALVIGFVWVFSYCILIPTLTGNWGEFGLDSKLGTCSIRPDANGHSSKNFLFVLGFCLPCVIIVACYASIYLVVRRSRRRMQQHCEQTKQSSGSRNEMHITKMVLVIFLCFVVCYLPITVVKITDTEDVKHPALHVLGYILVYASACVNPVVYVTMNKQYRRAYLEVLKCDQPGTIPDSQLTPPKMSKQPPSVSFLKGTPGDSRLQLKS